MMKVNKNNQISELIAKDFDARLEVAIISYIVDQGIEHLKNTTEDEISEIEGNGLMTAEFSQAFVKTAVKICKEYTSLDIMKFIRVSCYLHPFPKSITLYKEDITDSGWSEICDDLDLEEKEQKIEILVVKKEGEE